ncbi:TspO/MBR family protein [Streptomyces olivaceoviridis]|uniref:TspO/MBR family protein n=1 Tax=Streptomyces olivaceoviridis TaxID=1921 RepID=UPI0036B734D7
MATPDGPNPGGATGRPRLPWRLRPWARAVEADSVWYKALRKPLWQPPSWTFGAVWTPLYATIAYAAGHALGRTMTPRQRTRLISSLAVNLTLNADGSGCSSLEEAPSPPR